MTPFLPLSRHEKVAARAEAKRLRELSTADRAAEIIPVFGPQGITDGRPIEGLQICYWLMRSHRRGYRQSPRLRKPVIRSLHVLEDADLIENERGGIKVGGRWARLRATALGQEALADGTVIQHLASTSD